MNAVETSLINKLESSHIESRIEKLAITLEIDQFLQAIPFGSISEDFINHPTLKRFLTPVDADFPHVALRIAIEDYLLNKTNPEISTLKLEAVRIIILQSLKEATPEHKAEGTAQLPYHIVNTAFINELYRTQDDKLINLFMEYFPKPRSHVFKNTDVPSNIQRDEKEAAETIKPALTDLYEVEKQIKKVQRMFRAKMRKNQDIYRVMHYYDLKNREEAQDLLKQANTPYKPKTNTKLANRIMKAAKKVQLFTTIKHLTNPNALDSIMDNGLYGRKTLRDFYMDFKEASLYPFDIEQGDLNVVCMGADEIDSGSKHGIELCFDAKKISDNNPCVFFKQRDLGFTLKNKSRIVNIGDLEISFSHTELPKGNHKQREFLLFSPEQKNRYQREPYASSFVTNQLLISYNVNKMQQILTRNFFRYIDSLVATDPNTVHPMANEIYSALEKLNDEELAQALQDIGKKISDTMEFNFYGAYQIDFPALISVTNEETRFHLNLSDFIDNLNKGDLRVLSDAEKNLERLFKSYRFVDYLLSKVTNASAVAALQALRNNCQVPHYMNP